MTLCARCGGEVVLSVAHLKYPVYRVVERDGEEKVIRDDKYLCDTCSRAWEARRQQVVDSAWRTFLGHPDAGISLGAT